MKDSRIRVRTSKYYKQLYNDLKRFNIGDAHAVFFLAVCVGYAFGRKVPLEKDAEDRFYDYTIVTKERSVYKSIFLSENNFDLQYLQDEEKIIRLVEEYANGGMQYIIENISICFEQHDDGECVLKETEASQLSQRLLSLIYGQINQK